MIQMGYMEKTLNILLGWICVFYKMEAIDPKKHSIWLLVV